MDLRVGNNDLASVKNYNRILILSGSNLSETTKASFVDDCERIGINYYIYEAKSPHLDEFILVDDVIRYYAVSKGEVVGMEVGHRTGDAMRVISNFGFKWTNLDGGGLL